VRWSSRFIDFNVTRAEFGPVAVPAKPAPGQNGAAFFRLNVTAVPLRVRALPPYKGFPGYALIPMELAADRTRVLFYNELRVYGFLGRNGAGKTTTVKMLSTVLHPTSGTATVGGFDVQSEALKVRSIIGVIGEGTELARPFWTPMEYLRFFSRLQGGSDGDAK